MQKAILAINFRLASLRQILNVAGMPQSVLDDTQSRIDELETLLSFITR